MINPTDQPTSRVTALRCTCKLRRESLVLFSAAICSNQEHLCALACGAGRKMIRSHRRRLVKVNSSLLGIMSGNVMRH